MFTNQTACYNHFALRFSQQGEGLCRALNWALWNFHKGSSPRPWWPQQWAPGNHTDGHTAWRHRGYVEWRPGASRAQAPQPATGTFLILCAAANNRWKLSSIWLFLVKKDPTFSVLAILTWQEQTLVDKLIFNVYFHSSYTSFRLTRGGSAPAHMWWLPSFRTPPPASASPSQSGPAVTDLISAGYLENICHFWPQLVISSNLWYPLSMMRVNRVEIEW